MPKEERFHELLDKATQNLLLGAKVFLEIVGLHMAPDMPELAGTVLRGEITGLRKGKAIPFKDVGGILNSVIAKSRGMQEASDIDMHTVLFNVLKHKGVDVSKKPAPERMALLREISKQLSPHFQAVPGATTVEDKRKLMETIRTGKHPLTTEGTILHMPGGQTLKQKNVKETTLYLVGTYPGSGKRETTAGGILASTKPDGSSTLVRIGTGFDDDELKNIINNIDDYKGRALRVQHQGQFETGLFVVPLSLFVPSWSSCSEKIGVLFLHVGMNEHYRFASRQFGQTLWDFFPPMLEGVDCYTVIHYADKIEAHTCGVEEGTPIDIFCNTYTGDDQVHSIREHGFFPGHGSFFLDCSSDIFPYLFLLRESTTDPGTGERIIGPHVHDGAGIGIPDSSEPGAFRGMEKYTRYPGQKDWNREQELKWWYGNDAP